jgi:hypothetical protein
MFPLIGYVTRFEQQGDRFLASVDEPELFWNAGVSAASECYSMQGFPDAQPSARRSTWD